MAETDISICSRALVQLGANPISSFLGSEGDTAVICANTYPGLKKGIMGRYQWRFLMKKTSLSRDATDPIGEWKYAYVIPGDALSVPNAVFSYAEQVVAENQFEIFGRRIYCNYETLFLDYIAEVPEDQWPPFFADLMVKCVCAEIAFAVTDQQGVADNWTVRAYGTPAEGGVGGALGDAMALDGQGQANIGIYADVFTEARFTGEGW